MWSDNNSKILDVLDLLNSDITLPVKCPICNKTNVHIYMYRWKKEVRGTVWVWCSKCKTTAHERIDLPEWWINDDKLDENLLGVHPDMLESKNKFVDEYFNNLFHKYKEC